MKTKTLSLVISLLFFNNSYTFFSYINDESITFTTILTGDCGTSIDYNILNNEEGSIGGYKRLCGIHNMTVQVEGFEPVHLVENDVCMFPHLFTILNSLLSNENIFVQRWSCVKWFLPLSFGFKVQNNVLKISSSIFKYRFLSPSRAREAIPLIKKTNYIGDNSSDENLKITVSINGRSVVVEQKTVVQIYSRSSLHPYAVLARMLFL